MATQIFAKLFRLTKTHPVQEHYCSILYNFRRWAKLAKYLGFFPVQNVDFICSSASTNVFDLPVRTEGWRKITRRFLSWTFLHCFIMCLYFSISILQPLKYYISTYIEKGLVFESTTDRFALQVFLASTHVTSGIAPIFPVLMSFRIMDTLRTMRNYDFKYKINSSCIAFIDIPIFISIVCSITSLVFNYLITNNDFVNYITTDDDPIFPLSYLLIKNKLVTSLFIEVGHVYADLSLSFVFATMRYMSKFIEDRMLKIEKLLKYSCSNTQKLKVVLVNQISLVSISVPDNKEIVSATSSNLKEDWNEYDIPYNIPCEKFADLTNIVSSFNTAFRSFILGFLTISMLLAIASIYMVIIMIRNMSVSGQLFFWHQSKLSRSFNAMGTTSIVSIFRLLLLINVGERIENSVRSHNLGKIY